MAKLPAQSVDKIALEMYEVAAQEHSSINAKRRYGSGKHRKYLGMSAIGGACERKLWYDFRNYTPTPFDGRMALLFDDGNFYEDKLVKYLIMAGYPVEHTGKDQLEFARFDDLFKGHCDGVIHRVTQRPHILELKSANKNKFTSFQRFGVRQTYPVYYSQVQCYMGYSGLERALFVIYCKDNSEIYTERVYFMKHDFEALHARAEKIITANEPPGRAFNDKSVMDCQWCDYRIHCWTDEGMIMADDKVCGNCWYQTWKGLKSCCTHPGHPYFLHVWGIGCPDWSYIFDKDIGPHKLNRKPCVDKNQIIEAPQP